MSIKTNFRHFIFESDPPLPSFSKKHYSPQSIKHKEGSLKPLTYSNQFKKISVPSLTQTSPILVYKVPKRIIFKQSSFHSKREEGRIGGEVGGIQEGGRREVGEEKGVRKSGSGKELEERKEGGRKDENRRREHEKRQTGGRREEGGVCGWRRNEGRREQSNIFQKEDDLFKNFGGVKIIRNPKTKKLGEEKKKALLIPPNKETPSILHKEFGQKSFKLLYSDVMPDLDSSFDYLSSKLQKKLSKKSPIKANPTLPSLPTLPSIDRVSQDEGKLKSIFLRKSLRQKMVNFFKKWRGLEDGEPSSFPEFSGKLGKKLPKDLNNEKPTKKERKITNFDIFQIKWDQPQPPTISSSKKQARPKNLASLQLILHSKRAPSPNLAVFEFEGLLGRLDTSLHPARFWSRSGLKDLLERLREEYSFVLIVDYEGGKCMELLGWMREEGLGFDLVYRRRKQRDIFFEIEQVFFDWEGREGGRAFFFGVLGFDGEGGGRMEVPKECLEVFGGRIIHPRQLGGFRMVFVEGVRKTRIFERPANCEFFGSYLERKGEVTLQNINFTEMLMERERCLQIKNELALFWENVEKRKREVEEEEEEGKFQEEEKEDMKREEGGGRDKVRGKKEEGGGLREKGGGKKEEGGGREKGGGKKEEGGVGRKEEEGGGRRDEEEEVDKFLSELKKRFLEPFGNYLRIGFKNEEFKAFIRMIANNLIKGNIMTYLSFLNRRKKERVIRAITKERYLWWEDRKERKEERSNPEKINQLINLFKKSIFYSKGSL